MSTAGSIVVHGAAGPTALSVNDSTSSVSLSTVTVKTTGVPGSTGAVVWSMVAVVAMPTTYEGRGAPA